MIALLAWLLGRLAVGIGRVVARWFGRPSPGQPEPRGGGTRPVRLTFGEAESLLVAALLAGQIGQEEYRASLATLALADETRHPLEVPPLRD